MCCYVKLGLIFVSYNLYKEKKIGFNMVSVDDEIGLFGLIGGRIGYQFFFKINSLMIWHEDIVIFYWTSI
jgi:hypothetical protein